MNNIQKDARRMWQRLNRQYSWDIAILVVGVILFHLSLGIILPAMTQQMMPNAGLYMMMSLLHGGVTIGVFIFSTLIAWEEFHGRRFIWRRELTPLPMRDTGIAVMLVSLVLSFILHLIFLVILMILHTRWLPVGAIISHIVVLPVIHLPVILAAILTGILVANLLRIFSIQLFLVLPLLVASGFLFPLTYYPDALEMVFKFLPFALALDFIQHIAVGQFIFYDLIILLVWSVLLIVIIKLVIDHKYTV